MASCAGYLLAYGLQNLGPKRFAAGLWAAWSPEVQGLPYGVVLALALLLCAVAAPSGARLWKEEQKWSALRHGYYATLSFASGAALTASPLFVGGAVAFAAFLADLDSSPEGSDHARVDLDAPLSRFADDRFDREDFVDLVLRFLVTDSLVAPTIVITSPVGTGKTTVANFLAEKARARGNAFVRFDPWTLRLATDPLDALLLTIAEHLRKLGPSLISPLQARRFLSDTVRGLVDHRWLAGFQSPAAQLLGPSKERLAAALRDALGESRLIVFIDDLDRCEPEVAKRLLMATHELLRVPGLVFLYAFDRTRMGAKINELEELLLKTADYCFDLSLPTEAQLAALDDASLAAQPPNGDALRDAFQLLSHVLPETPRERKRFCGHALAWVDSAIPEHLDPGFVIALLLLEFRAPGALVHAERTDAVSRDLWFPRLNLGPAKDEPSGVTRPGGPWTGDRLGEAAYDFAREVGNRVGAVSEHLAWLLNTTAPSLSRLDFCTRRVRSEGAWPQEYSLYFKVAQRPERARPVRKGGRDGIGSSSVKRPVDVRRGIVKKLRDAGPDATAEQLLDLCGLVDDRASIEVLLDAREQGLKEMVEARLESEQLRIRHQVLSNTVARRILVDRGAATQESVRRALAGMLRWLRFPGAVYKPIHDEEWKLSAHMLRCADLDPLHLWADLEELEREHEHQGAVAIEAVKKLKTSQVSRVAEVLVGRFLDGKLGTGSTEENSVERAFILDVKSSFHSAQSRGRLHAAVAEAPRRSSVCEGAEQAWRMTLAGIETAPDLSRDREWILLLFAVITASPLNRRMAGTLESDMKSLEGVGWKADEVPLPDWWADVMGQSHEPWSPPPAIS